MQTGLWMVGGFQILCWQDWLGVLVGLRKLVVGLMGVLAVLVGAWCTQAESTLVVTCTVFCCNNHRNNFLSSVFTLAASFCYKLIYNFDC